MGNANQAFRSFEKLHYLVQALGSFNLQQKNDPFLNLFL